MGQVAFGGGERSRQGWGRVGARCKMSDADFSRRMPADPTRFVLVGASHAGNVGATARAMKVMGFTDLVLVAPRFADVQRRPEAIAMASGATDILAGARVAARLDEALDGITYVCATAMTPRDFGPPNRAPRELFATLAPSTHRVAFVFGSERFGLANDDVYACHACLTIPTDPAYGSLNLAQAVQLIAYDWRQAQGGFGAPARAIDPRRADAAAVHGLVAHWQSSLEALGFLDPRAPKKLVARLRRLANRAELSTEEVDILRGIARAIDERSR
jgi:tRNA/rRNA methyltransferase